MDIEENKIFVYGSLLENFFNYDLYLVGKVKKRSYGRTRGKLYHLKQKGYPAMIEGNEYIYGEILELICWEDTIVQLDKMEGYYGENNPGNEYNRILIEVEDVERHSKEAMFAYVYNCKEEKELKNDIYLPHGNWRTFMKK